MVDYLIIGGGIVGLSTAWQLQRRKPDASIVLVEKEDRFAAHQTGRNSGVIHAGIYYTPGSLKAKFCKDGVDATISFCHDNNIRVEQCGKLLVATDEVEYERMLALFERANRNGLDVELLDARELSEREPNIVGTGAIFLKTTGIADYPEISRHFARKFEALGGQTRLKSEVVALNESDDSVIVLQGHVHVECHENYSRRDSLAGLPFMILCVKPLLLLAGDLMRGLLWLRGWLRGIVVGEEPGHLNGFVGPEELESRL